MSEHDWAWYTRTRNRAFWLGMALCLPFTLALNAAFHLTGWRAGLVGLLFGVAGQRLMLWWLRRER